MKVRLRYFPLFTFLLVAACAYGRGSGNTITKDDFNFGHQLGYLYSRTDSAYFRQAGERTFETGFLGYYTKRMPMVRNSHWRERLMLLAPLSFEVYPCSTIALQFELTDLFVELPYKDIHSMGGKSPRFRTKMLLMKEGRHLPATALTVGFKFSSAKPYTIWDNSHNYDESNGLAGACTGVTDYLMIFTFSKRVAQSLALHARFGLATLGSPVEYVRGSGQADEFPYGFTVDKSWGTRWSLKSEVSGMYNGLRTTRLAHYSVIRLSPAYHFNSWDLRFNLEKGLTRETDEWVLGFYTKFFFGKAK
jgi:hypothetical protein